MNSSSIVDPGATNQITNAGQSFGDVSTAGSQAFSKFLTGFLDFFHRITLIEWILISVVIIFIIIVVVLTKKFNLKFRLWPKKPKKSFN